MGDESVGGLSFVAGGSGGGSSVAVGGAKVFFDGIVRFGVLVLGSPFATCEFKQSCIEKNVVSETDGGIFVDW